jgi:hypothetical protein
VGSCGANVVEVAWTAPPSPLCTFARFDCAVGRSCTPEIADGPLGVVLDSLGPRVRFPLLRLSLGSLPLGRREDPGFSDRNAY